MMLCASMKTRTIIAFALIVIGIAALSYEGVRWSTREKVIDAGPLQVSAERWHSIPVPPFVGVLVLVGGVVLLFTGRKSV